MGSVKELINYLYKHPLIRYLFVGGTTFMLDFCLLVLLHGGHKISIPIATSIAYWISVSYNFLLNRSWTFSSNEKKKLHKHLTAYGTLLIFNYVFTVLFVSFFSHHIPYTVAKAVAVIIQTSWNYQIYKRVIFNNPEPAIATAID